jgi:hypothetical protein
MSSPVSSPAPAVGRHPCKDAHCQKTLKGQAYKAHLPRWVQVSGAAVGGTGCVGLAAAGIGIAGALRAIGRLSKIMKTDLGIIQRHTAMLSEGKALRIQWRDMPESFKTLKGLSLSFDKELFDERGIANEKAIVKMVGEWVPFVATLYNGFPRETRVKLLRYVLSPTFWLKDLGSPDAMWLKKAVTILGTPAKKMTQLVGEVVDKYKLERFEEAVKGLNRAADGRWKDAFRWKPQQEGSRLKKIGESLQLSFLARMAIPLRRGVLDIQSNAPPLPMKDLMEQVSPYFTKTYPQLNTSKDKWKVLNVASIGHILSHHDVPEHVFKLVRPISPGTSLASARVVYGVLTILPEPIIETWLKSRRTEQNAELMDSLMESLKRFGRSQEFATLAYQLSIQMVKGFEDETNVVAEAAATTAFRKHYHRPDEFGTIVPAIKGVDAENKVIEMERIMEPIGFAKLDETDRYLSYRKKAEGLYGYLMQALHFSDTHMLHADLHSGQLVYSQQSKQVGLLDHAAYMRLNPSARKAMVNTLLIAHRNNGYYRAGIPIPDGQQVLTWANHLGMGIQGLRQDASLANAYAKPHNMTFLPGMGVLKQLQGEHVNNWNAIYSCVKARSLVANVSNVGRHLNTRGEPVLNKPSTLTSEQQQAIQFLSKSTLNTHVARVVENWLAQKDPALSLTAADEHTIHQSVVQEFESIFGQYIQP